MTRVDFDKERHPSDPVCQSGSLVTTALELQRRYERVTREGNPYDMQFIAADAIAYAQRLEGWRLEREQERGVSTRGRAAISRPRPLALADDSNVIPFRRRHQPTGGAA